MPHAMGMAQPARGARARARSPRTWPGRPAPHLLLNVPGAYTSVSTVAWPALLDIIEGTQDLTTIFNRPFVLYLCEGSDRPGSLREHLEPHGIDVVTLDINESAGSTLDERWGLLSSRVYRAIIRLAHLACCIG